MARYTVDITGINTSDINILTNEEMVDLFLRYQNGDLSAKEELISGNLRLVLSILKTFNRTDINLDDLFQVGVIGLIKAIDNFDLSYGLKLSTYAVPLIIGEIKRYIRDNSTIHISRSIKDLAYQIIKFKENYIAENGCEPPASVIASSLNLEEYQIAYALDAIREPASIFEPIYNDGGDTIYLFDQIADVKENDNHRDMLISLYKALQKIQAREKDILINRFIIGKTQTEIADSLGISQAQVSRLEKSAIESVRKLIK